MSRSVADGLPEEGAMPREGAVLREDEGAGVLLREGAVLRDAEGAGELLREGAALRDGAGAGVLREGEGTAREAVRGAGAGLLARGAGAGVEREPPLMRGLALEPPLEPPRVLRWASTCVKGIANSVNAATINPEKISLRGVSIACLRQRPGASVFQSDPERKKEPPGIPASKGPLRQPV